ncbi:MAG TPA: helix-turn-helix domain-containing protein [Chryseolinea sp.]
MNYQTFPPHPDLNPLVKCYWTLEVPAGTHERQRIIPDGCIEMIFILGDNVKRFTSGDNFLIQPRAMILGQTTDPFFIQPTGYVNTFAVRFYPYGFTTFVTASLKQLANTETPLGILFGEKQASDLERKIVQASGTNTRIGVIEEFLLNKLKNKSTIDHIVKSTIDVLLSTGGSKSINSILENDLSKKRQLERKFIKHVGISPKQLGKVIRLQTALRMLLNQQSESLTKIAYDSAYYDQAHFIKDFKEFTGINPKEFLEDEKMVLSTIFYKED